MTHSKKIIINTSALYIKIVAVCIVQLLATRIALQQLGADAFGLYNLIAGVIILLSFLNGALMISVQRYLSISIGEEDFGKMASIFNVSVLIHLVLAIIIAVSFLLLRPFLFNGFLSIPVSLSKTAVTIYSLMIISSAVTVLSLPYSACINAREDMWYFAITEIVGCVLKLWAAVSLYFVSSDKLLVYTAFMVLAIIISSLMRYLWCRYKYQESRISITLMMNRPLICEMLGFVGWNTLGAAAVVTRNQGIAVLLNIFYSTAINAAYGVASQVNSLVLSFSTTLTTVFTPTIIQKKGSGDIEGMLKAAKLSSKISFLLSSLIAIPIIVYMDDVFRIWLGNIPEHTAELTLWIVISFVITQLTPGINRAIYASGVIKWYQIWTAVCLLINIPVGYMFLKAQAPAYTVILIMAVLQIVSTAITVYYARKNCALDVRSYIWGGLCKPVLLFSLVTTALYLFDHYIYTTSSIVRICVISSIADAIYMALYFLSILDQYETKLLSNVIRRN